MDLKKAIKSDGFAEGAAGVISGVTDVYAMFKDALEPSGQRFSSNISSYMTDTPVDMAGMIGQEYEGTKNPVKNSLSGLVKGVSTGAAFGGVGAIVGGAAGLGLGVAADVIGAIRRKKEKEAFERERDSHIQAAFGINSSLNFGRRVGETAYQSYLNQLKGFDNI